MGGRPFRGDWRSHYATWRQGRGKGTNPARAGRGYLCGYENKHSTNRPPANANLKHKKTKMGKCWMPGVACPIRYNPKGAALFHLRGVSWRGFGRLSFRLARWTEGGPGNS